MTVEATDLWFETWQIWVKKFLQILVFSLQHLQIQFKTSVPSVAQVIYLLGAPRVAKPSFLNVQTNVGPVYTSNAFISKINVNNGTKESTHGYQNCNTTEILIFGGYVKVRESLCTRVSIWVNTILSHIDTRAILLRYKDFLMVYWPEWYWKQKYHQIPIPYW